MSTGTKVVPLVPTEAQWNGLARSIIMAFDMDAKTPRKLLKHLERSGVDVPQWMRDEHEMQHMDHTISKGTRATLIYRAMVEDAPPAQVGNGEVVARITHSADAISRMEITPAGIVLGYGTHDLFTAPPRVEVTETMVGEVCHILERHGYDTRYNERELVEKIAAALSSGEGE